MNKEQKKTAIQNALADYRDNLSAVQESDIPGGFDQLVKDALVKSLSGKFESIFDQPGDVSANARALTKSTAKRVTKPAKPAKKRK